MAYGNPGSGSAYAAKGGSEDMFSDAPESKGEERMTPHDEEKEHDDKDYGETAVIPKSLLGGKDFQPGEEMVVQIVSVHGDQVEIKYAPEKGGGEKKEEGGPAPGEESAPKGDSEMQSMMY